MKNHDLLLYNTTEYKNYTLLKHFTDLHQIKNNKNISLYFTNVGTVVYSVPTVPNWVHLLK